MAVTNAVLSRMVHNLFHPTKNKGPFEFSDNDILKAKFWQFNKMQNESDERFYYRLKHDETLNVSRRRNKHSIKHRSTNMTFAPKNVR